MLLIAGGLSFRDFLWDGSRPILPPRRCFPPCWSRRVEREQSTGHVRPRGAETLAVHPLSPYHVVRLSELQTRPSPHLLGALIISSFIHVGRHIPHVCPTYCHAGPRATLGRTVACFFAGGHFEILLFLLVSWHNSLWTTRAICELGSGLSQPCI